MSHTPQLELQNYFYLELLEPVSANSEDSGLSHTEAIPIPLTDDLDYQESSSATIPHSNPTTSTSKSPQASGLILPRPPARPAHWFCDPAWHWDSIKSPDISDVEEGEEADISDQDDSEEGAIPESSSGG